MEEDLLIQDSEGTIWGPLEVHTPAVATQAWFQSTVTKLRYDNPTFRTEDTLVSPIGSP